MGHLFLFKHQPQTPHSPPITPNRYYQNRCLPVLSKYYIIHIDYRTQNDNEKRVRL
jgi:hypothetical protein